MLIIAIIHIFHINLIEHAYKAVLMDISLNKKQEAVY